MSAPVLGEDGRLRCPWASTTPLMRAYHDIEWGIPVSGDDAVFERLCLEAFQAGLSWRTVLEKRPRFREVFADFVIDEVAALTDADLEAALGDAGIIRNRAKIYATRTNARAAQALRDHGGLAALVAAHAPDQTPRPGTAQDLQSTSAESVQLSTTLKRNGFTFVGPTTMYALLEALGYVDTHLLGCFRRGSSGRWPSADEG